MIKGGNKIGKDKTIWEKVWQIIKKKIIVN